MWVKDIKTGEVADLDETVVIILGGANLVADVNPQHSCLYAPENGVQLKSPITTVCPSRTRSRVSTSRVLRSEGWTVVEAHTGQEALDKVPQGIDLVVLDVQADPHRDAGPVRQLELRPADDRRVVVQRVLHPGLSP